MPILNDLLFIFKKLLCILYNNYIEENIGLFLGDLFQILCKQNSHKITNGPYKIYLWIFQINIQIHLTILNYR